MSFSTKELKEFYQQSNAKKVRSMTAEGKLTCEQEDCIKSALEGHYIINDFKEC